MNKNTMIISINNKAYKLNKATRSLDASSRMIENFTQILGTYRIAGHIVQLTKNYMFGEFTQYTLDVVTGWKTEGHWAYVSSCRRLTASANIKEIVDYAHDLIEKDKEFGKKLLNLND